MKSIAVITLALVIMSSVIGCGGEATTSNNATTDDLSTKQIGSLTEAELGQFCDWTAAQQGGYGAKLTCDGGTSVDGYKDQAACVDRSRSPRCTATVGDAKTCISAIAKNPCSLASFNEPTCVPLFTCAFKAPSGT